MKILHYLLGLPPVRGGGMVKYALDLIESQARTEEVYLLLPGQISFRKTKRSRVRVKRCKPWKLVPVYRILNPLPIPMSNGILDIAWYTRPCDLNIYQSFLEELQPEVVHIHTFMGLHAEFLQAAEQMHIPVIYTSHDYFGLCPKANLMFHGATCTRPGERCSECCMYAFSEKRLLLEQSNIYMLYRERPAFVHLLQSKLLRNFFNSYRSFQPTGSNVQRNKLSVAPMKEEYRALLDYYKKMFCHISYFHFNSHQAKEVYEKILGPLPGELLPITNQSIQDRRCLRYVGSVLRVGFLGGDAPYKGLKRLQECMKELYDEGLTDIELHIYGSRSQDYGEFCRYHKSYTSDELSQVFKEMDVLAVPSYWMETFGMVVLEALSFAVPVIVTDKVGAKDMINRNGEPLGCIIDSTVSALKQTIKYFYLHRNELQKLNDNIMKADIDFSYMLHLQKLKTLYWRSIRS